MMQFFCLQSVVISCKYCRMNDDAVTIDALKHVASISAGHPIRGSVDALQPGDTGVIQLRDVSADHEIGWSGIKRVLLPKSREIGILGTEDVLFAGRGMRCYALAVGEAPFPAVAAPHFFVIKIQDTNVISPKFLAWQLNQRPAQDYFQRVSAGTAQRSIRRSSLEELEIQIPSLYKQNMICELWATAQAEQRRLRRLEKVRNKQLEAIAFDLLNQNEGTHHE